ncbi:MAG: lamin tail domain-containing protein [Kofleriaceae bacterium]
MTRRGWLGGLAALATAASACGFEDGGGTSCKESLLPGDLVITEIFADADAPSGSSGTDEGREWFEIYNATDRTLDLAGVTLRLSRPDGTKAKVATLSTLIVAPGDYVVVGNVLPELKPAWVDYGYAAALGDLYNTDGGLLAVGCGGVDLDVATYDAVVVGSSQQFDGSAAPDYTANDDLANWCPATPELSTEFEPANYGTPGEPNQDCEVVVPGMCLDGDTLRPTVAPTAGDLVITEIMANPDGVDDAFGEWFELLATADVDLNGVGLDRAGDAREPDLLGGERCLHVAAGERVVVARSADPTVNGGLPAVAGTFRFTMTSGSPAAPGDVRVLVGDTVIDAFVWAAPVGAGRSLQLDPDFETAAANDEERVWCDGDAPYGTGEPPDRGTPGAANAECEILPAAGMCADVGGDRAIVAPTPGQLVITEIMPSPDAVSDSTGEWFEVQALADVDLNDLGLDRAGDTRNPDLITAAACLPVTAGDRLVFARSADAGANGGLAAVAATFGFTMVTGSPASPGDVRVLAGDTVIDAFAWTGGTANGASLQLDPDYADAGSNDTERFWCLGGAPYGDGDLGTPGAANGECVIPPPPGFCVDPGTGAERAIVAPAVGQLIFTEFMASPDAPQADKEWIELVNLGPTAIDLNDLTFDRVDVTSTDATIRADACLPVAPGGFVLWARSADPLVNGDLPVVDGTFGFSLVAGTDMTPCAVEVRAGATVIDAASWIGAPNQTSRQLDPDFFDATSNDLDDRPAMPATSHYCDGVGTYGPTPNTGTPKASNAQCP